MCEGTEVIRWNLVEVISRKLEDADQVGEISWRPVWEDDDLQAADEQRAMEDILLQNTLKKSSSKRHIKEELSRIGSGFITVILGRAQKITPIPLWHSPTGQCFPESSSLSQWRTPGSCSRAPPPGGNTSLPFLQSKGARHSGTQKPERLTLQTRVHLPLPIPLFSAPLPSKCCEKSWNMPRRRLVMTSLGSLAHALRKNN